MIVKQMLNFPTIAMSTALILLFPASYSQARGGATPRYDAYSTASAHGGGDPGPYDPNNGAYKASTGAYAAGNCTHCHEQHAGSVTTATAGPMLFADLANNDFCNYCHGGTPLNNADSISPQITKTKAHKPSGGSSDVLCNDCHQDSHAATTQTHDQAPQGEGTNLVSGALSNILGVVPIWNYGAPPPAPGVGGETMNNASFGAPTPATFEYELCLDCHGSQAVVLGLNDISGQFDPQNVSVHPVATTGTYKNQAITNNLVGLMTTPWQNVNSKMYCSDCHGSDNWSVDPKGPHGSNNQYLLKDEGPLPFGGILDTLCDNCHITASPNINGATGGGFSAFDDVPAWNPNGATILGDHTYIGHTLGPINTVGCVACHGGLGAANSSNIHGANFRSPDPPAGGTLQGVTSKAFLVDPTYNPFIYTDTNFPTQRFCASVCHANFPAGYRYK